MDDKIVIPSASVKFENTQRSNEHDNKPHFPSSFLSVGIIENLEELTEPPIVDENTPCNPFISENLGSIKSQINEDDCINSIETVNLNLRTYLHSSLNNETRNRTEIPDEMRVKDQNCSGEFNRSQSNNENEVVTGCNTENLEVNNPTLIKRKSVRIANKEKDVKDPDQETTTPPNDEVKFQPSNTSETKEPAVHNLNASQITSHNISVAHVMENLKVYGNDKDSQVFQWIISSIKTRCVYFSKKFTKQFDAMRELNMYIESQSTDTREKWWHTLRNAKYTTPRTLHGWQLVFGYHLPPVCSQFSDISLSFFEDNKKTRKKNLKKDEVIVYNNNNFLTESSEKEVKGSAQPENYSREVNECCPKVSTFKCKNKIKYMKALKQLQSSQQALRKLERDVETLQRILIKKNIKIKKLEESRILNSHHDTFKLEELKYDKGNKIEFGKRKKQGKFEYRKFYCLKEEKDVVSRQEKEEILPGKKEGCEVSDPKPPKNLLTRSPSKDDDDDDTFESKNGQTEFKSVNSNLTENGNGGNSSLEGKVPSALDEKKCEIRTESGHSKTLCLVKYENPTPGKIYTETDKSRIQNIIPTSTKHSSSSYRRTDSNCCSETNSTQKESVIQLSNFKLAPLPSASHAGEIKLNVETQIKLRPQKSNEFVPTRGRQNIEVKALNNSVSITRYKVRYNEHKERIPKDIQSSRCDVVKECQIVIDVKNKLKQISNDLRKRSSKQDFIKDVKSIKQCEEKLDKLESDIKEKAFKLNLYEREIKALQTDLINNELVLRTELNEKEFLESKYNELKKRISPKLVREMDTFPNLLQAVKDSETVSIKPIEDSNTGSTSNNSLVFKCQGVISENEKLRNEIQGKCGIIECLENEKRIMEAEILAASKKFGNLEQQIGMKQYLINRLEYDVKVLKESNARNTQELDKEKELIENVVECQKCKIKIQQIQDEIKRMKSSMTEEITATKKLHDDMKSTIEKSNLELKVKEEECSKLVSDLTTVIQFVEDLRNVLGLSSSENRCETFRISFSNFNEELEQIKLYYSLNKNSLKRNEKIVHSLVTQMKSFKKDKGKYAKGNKILRKKILNLRKNLRDLQSEINVVKRELSPNCRNENYADIECVDLSSLKISSRELEIKNAQLEHQLSQEKHLTQVLTLRSEQLEAECERLTELLKREYSEASRQLELQLAMFCSTSERYREQLKRIEESL